MKRTILSALLIFLFSFLAVSQELTVTWEDEVQLTDLDRHCWVPKAALWDDAVHVVWMSESEDWFDRVLIRSSYDRGETWNNQNRISPWLSAIPIFDETPYIAVWEEDLHVVFREHDTVPPSFYGIAYSASTDSGYIWYDPPLQLSDGGLHPLITVWEDWVNVVSFHAGYTVHSISSDGGQTFAPPDTIADIGDSNQSGRGFAFENYVFLAYRSTWYPSITAEVFFQRSTDYGQTFESYVMLSTEGMNHSQMPSLNFTQNGEVYVSWMDYKYSPYALTGDVFVRHSPDFGEHWEEEVQVTADHYAVTNSISSIDSQVHVVWADYRLGSSESELYFSSSNDYGWTWSDTMRLTNAAHQSFSPDLVQKADTLHIVWNDKRDGIRFQIYYKRGFVDLIPGFMPTTPLAPPEEISLSVNPNPFNESTIISFQLPAAGEVELGIFDIFGRNLQMSGSGTTPTTEYFPAGFHQIMFDGSDLPSGIYIYRLAIEKYTACGKMVLMK